MGLFNFFKRSTQQRDNSTKVHQGRFTRNEVDDLVLSSLNLLCDDVSTVDDVIKMLKSQGYDDRQASIIAERAESLYQKHFAVTKKESKVGQGKSLNEIYAEKRAQNNGSLPLNETPDSVREEFESFLDQGFSSGNITAEFTPNPAHTRENVDQKQIDRYIGYGAFQLEHKNFENAIELFNKAIELGDKTGLAYANLGSLHHKLKNYELSIENYDEAIKLNSNHAGFYSSKAQVLADFGNKTNAKLSYENAIQLNNSDTFALNNLGILLTEEEKYSEALGYFDKVLAIGEPRFIEAVDRCLALDEKNPTALGYKIQILLKEQKLTEALDGIDTLFSTHYSQQKLLNLFTYAYNQLDKEAAMLRFRRLAKQLDANATYQLGYMRGLYLKEKGYHDEAVSTFNFLNEEREFSWNYYQIAIIENLKGNTERCLLYLKKTFELEPELKDDAKEYVELQNLAGNVNFQLLVRE